MPISRKNTSKLYISIGEQLQKFDIDQAIEFIRKTDRVSQKSKRAAIDTLRALTILKKTALANSRNQSPSTLKLINAVSLKLATPRIQKMFFNLGQQDLVNQLLELNQGSVDAVQQYQNSLLQYKNLLDYYRKYLSEDTRAIKKHIQELRYETKNGISQKPERLSKQLAEMTKRLSYYKQELTNKMKNSQDVFHALNDDYNQHANLFTRLEINIGTSEQEEVARQLPIVKQRRSKLDHEYSSICRNKKHFLDEIKQSNKEIEQLENDIELVALENKVDDHVNNAVFKRLKKELMQSEVFQQFQSQLSKGSKSSSIGDRLIKKMQNSGNLAELRSITTQPGSL